MRRTWIKLWVDQCLRGSMISELSAEQRWIWIGFLLLAGDSPRPGTIFCRLDAEHRPVGWSNGYLADALGVTEEAIQTTKEIMVAKNKIMIEETGVVHIVNWAKYQSEYERQKPHRSPAFMNIREEIKERDGCRCQKCGKAESELMVPLCIHHIDDNPANNDPDNLISLCLPCHSTLKRSKAIERKFNKPIEQKLNGEGEREGEREGEKEEGRKRPDPLPRHYDLATFLEGSIKENVPFHKFQGKDYLNAWANEFRLMEERDKVPLEAIKTVLEWSQKHKFWRRNILSAETLREKFGRLAAEMRDDGGSYRVSQAGGRPPRTEAERKFDREREAEARRIAGELEAEREKAKAKGDKIRLAELQQEFEDRLGAWILKHQPAGGER